MGECACDGWAYWPKMGHKVEGHHPTCPRARMAAALEVFLDENAPLMKALAGYEGDPCPCCKKLKRVRSGDLWACDGCGARGRLEE